MPSYNPIPPIPNVRFTPDLGTQLSPSAGQPIVLFPVRLETRFFPTATGEAVVCVRVYPDKVHVDTHEPELTEQEIIWGKNFWEQTWRAGNSEEAQKLAWRQLADRFDARRAAWIARALRPLNPEDRPAQPVAAEQPLPKPIKFPDPKTKPDTWTRAPVARALPNNWHVLGYANGRLVAKAVGKQISETLATGPDPSKSTADGGTTANPDEELAIDAGMKWMVDFAEAENVGMGIRLPLPTLQGLDFLLVLGTKAAPDGTDGTPKLVELLEAHHYTDGLSFVLNGTPSNNTKDAPSGFSSVDPGHAESYQAERSATAFQPGDGSNADALATAFGLRNGNGQVFANLINAQAAEQVDARHMNRALWPATFGYFLLQMLGLKDQRRTTLTLDDLSWARQHFIDYVRASGPLPVLRVGKQPYGVLPVTSLHIWKPKAGQEQQYARDVTLQGFLFKLREIWRKNLTQVPRVGRSADPDQDFADIFSMDGISSSYAIRHLMGYFYLTGLWTYFFPNDPIHIWWQRHDEMTGATLKNLGLNWVPTLYTSTYSGWYRQLTGPLTQAEMLSETAPLSPNFIDLLLNAPTLDTLFREDFPEPKPKSLLYALLRHALLLEYRTAAINLLNPNKEFFSYYQQLSEGELVAIPNQISGPSIRDVLNRPVPEVTNDPVGKFLHELRSTSDPKVAPQVATLFEMRESLARLKTLSAAKLQRLFTSTLDPCSHRLDAWITSFATKRLDEMRKANPIGILLGGYGWVMNLKPAPALTFETPPPGEQGVFFRAANNPGYTHTPSLAQAATVAVLRSGHLTHSNVINKDVLAIDLSSERVRLADWLLDGVRQGQPLGALLGYRFERRLQEAKLALFISLFRAVAPLVANKLEQTNQPVESIAANNVVDGLLLQRKWKSALQNPAFQPDPLLKLFNQAGKQPDQNRYNAARTTLVAELNLLDDAVDAVSDALLAESVHHAVQGNPLRTSSTLDAIASGETSPPELEVVRTPRTGIALTHRLVTLFSGAPTIPPAWQNPAQPLRANAEPNLNAWAARLLGSPANVRCLIERYDTATGAVLETKELRLNELRLSPLDYIYATEGSRDAQPSEIEQRILYTMRRKPAGFAADAALRINPGRGAGWGVNELSYGEFAELVRTTRKLITGARGIDASDLNLPERNQAAAIDLVELETRANNAERALRQAQTDMQRLINAPASTNLEPLREVILRSSYFGVASSIPLSVAGSSTADRDLLLLQANSIAKELAQRLEQFTALQTGFNPATATLEEKRDFQLNRLRATFGDSFVVLPRFTPENAVELDQALTDSAKIQDNDPLAAVTWFQRAARVRDGVARLDAALRYAEALGTGERLNLAVAQLPYRQNDRWVGLPLKAGQPLSASRFSLVVQALAKVDTKQPLTGLLIDEWVEVVPNDKETTGVVFQFNQPDAMAPQCILLAVPPDLEQTWNLWSLQQVLLETLDLARLRAVDPEALDEVGHYLPALYFAVNKEGETVSTDFSKLK